MMCGARSIIGNTVLMACAPKFRRRTGFPARRVSSSFPPPKSGDSSGRSTASNRCSRSPILRGIRRRNWSIAPSEAFDLPVEPWVPFTNSMDFEHLRVLHGLKIDFDPKRIRVGDYRIQYDVRFEDPNLGVFDQCIRVTGTNTIALAGKLNGMSVCSMATGTPTPDGRTIGWMVTATPRSEAAPEQRARQLQIGEAFFKRLIEEDTPVMSTAHFREGVLIEADRALAMFFQYVKRFPCARPAAHFD